MMLFKLGTVLCSHKIDHFMTKKMGRLKKVEKCIRRHANGDWGIIRDEDEGVNEKALEDGTRIVSVYRVDGEEIYIMTEADRSSTKVVFPSDLGG